MPSTKKMRNHTRLVHPFSGLEVECLDSLVEDMVIRGWVEAPKITNSPLPRDEKASSDPVPVMDYLPDNLRPASKPKKFQPYG